MEHKLIKGGGEQYLPFARSRIRSLRATGLKNASQQFEVDGCSIKVRIEGAHEFINIAGGSVEVLSGVTKAGEISPDGVVDLGQPDLVRISADGGDSAARYRLRSYKPTLQTWTSALKKALEDYTGGYVTASRLGVLADSQLDIPRYIADPLVHSQYSHVCSSMYSGLIAQAVQIVQGVGRLNPGSRGSEKRDGVVNHYDFHWRRCHGIVRGLDNTPWLIEISAANGVIACPLPVFAVNPNSKIEAVREAYKVFGGVPTGKLFPADLAGAIAKGTVRELISPEDMAEYFSKEPYSTAMGWSFNIGRGEPAKPTDPPSVASVAHNTCWHRTDDGLARGCHYKIAFDIGAKEAGKARWDAPASAQLSLEGEGVLAGSRSKFSMYEPTHEIELRDGEGNPAGYAHANEFPDDQRPSNTVFPPVSHVGYPAPSEIREPRTVTIFVCHINNALEKIWFVEPPANPDVENEMPPLPGPKKPLNFNYQTEVVVGAASSSLEERLAAHIHTSRSVAPPVTVRTVSHTRNIVKYINTSGVGAPIAYDYDFPGTYAEWVSSYSESSGWSVMSVQGLVYNINGDSWSGSSPLSTPPNPSWFSGVNRHDGTWAWLEGSGLQAAWPKGARDCYAFSIPCEASVSVHYPAGTSQTNTFTPTGPMGVKIVTAHGEVFDTSADPRTEGPLTAQYAGDKLVLVNNGGQALGVLYDDGKDSFHPRVERFNISVRYSMFGPNRQTAYAFQPRKSDLPDNKKAPIVVFHGTMADANPDTPNYSFIGYI